jgi:hypothetical protein
MQKQIIALFTPKFCFLITLSSAFGLFLMFALNFNHYIMPYALFFSILILCTLCPLICFLGISIRTIYLRAKYSSVQLLIRVIVLLVLGLALFSMMSLPLSVICHQLIPY